MMKVIEKAFPEVLETDKGKEIMDKMIPSWGKPVEPESFNANLETAKEILQL